MGIYAATTGDSGDHLGKAQVTLEVSMQPGNNYRAGASCLQDALNQAPTGQTMQQVADALNQRGGNWLGYFVFLTWSPMLTVPLRDPLSRRRPIRAGG